MDGLHWHLKNLHNQKTKKTVSMNCQQEDTPPRQLCSRLYAHTSIYSGTLSGSSQLLHSVEREKDELSFYKSLQIKQLQLKQWGVDLLFQIHILPKELANTYPP